MFSIVPGVPGSPLAPVKSTGELGPGNPGEPWSPFSPLEPGPPGMPLLPGNPGSPVAQKHRNLRDCVVQSTLTFTYLLINVLNLKLGLAKCSSDLLRCVKYPFNLKADRKLKNRW